MPQECAGRLWGLHSGLADAALGCLCRSLILVIFLRSWLLPERWFSLPPRKPTVTRITLISPDRVVISLVAVKMLLPKKWAVAICHRALEWHYFNKIWSCFCWNADTEGPCVSYGNFLLRLHILTTPVFEPSSTFANLDLPSRIGSTSSQDMHTIFSIPINFMLGWWSGFVHLLPRLPLRSTLTSMDPRIAPITRHIAEPYPFAMSAEISDGLRIRWQIICPRTHTPWLHYRAVSGHIFLFSSITFH